jgi:succinate dehydrogenase assembly factor 1
MSIRRSGLQLEVLALYRRSVIFLSFLRVLYDFKLYSALRIVHTKPPTTQPKFLLFARYTFRTQASSVSTRDVAAIEHLLRKGSRQLDGLEQTNVKDCWVSKEMEEWDRRTRAGGQINSP